MSAALSVLVVDDEAPARRRLRRLVEAVPGAAVVEEAEDGEVAVERIVAHAPDVVLLDINMPRLDGFGVVAALGEEMPLVVFCTAYDEHALPAFEARAVDYLLKPVQPERLADALARCRALRDGAAADRKRGLQAVAAVVEEGQAYLPRLLVRDDRRAYLLTMDRVDQIRADRNYCWVKSEGRKFRVRRTLASLERRLDPAHFLRINKSDIVRLDAMAEIHPWSHGDYRVVMRDGTTLSWSRRYRAAAADG